MRTRTALPATPGSRTRVCLRAKSADTGRSRCRSGSRDRPAFYEDNSMEKLTERTATGLGDGDNPWSKQFWHLALGWSFFGAPSIPFQGTNIHSENGRRWTFEAIRGSSGQSPMSGRTGPRKNPHSTFRAKIHHLAKRRSTTLLSKDGSPCSSLLA
jgi:hypothetical protein